MGIKIKKPCGKDWNKMVPTEKGAFCDSCSLEVMDFTSKSSVEIKSILKSELGKHVCAKMKDEQLEELNYEFLQWKNSQQGFQRTWILSLVVVFGLSLFSCQEEKEQEAIVSVQEIGWSVNQHVESISKKLDVVVTKDSLIQPVKSIEPETLIKRELIENITFGKVEFKEKDVELPIEERIKIDTIPEYYLGGLGYSTEYHEYLEEEIQANIKVAFNALAFPNPAIKSTTLKITFPTTAKANIQLFNNYGQLIRDVRNQRFKEGIYEIPIDLSELPKGMYLMTINSKEYKKSVKVIKT